jgi:hypothetical protein
MTTDASTPFGRPLAGPDTARTWQRTQNTLAAITRATATGRVPATGVQATIEQGFLQVLGVAEGQLAEHLELAPESACQYCRFGAVCGRSWEQTW